MCNELERGIQIKSDNGTVYLPSDATAKEINELAKIEMGKQISKAKSIPFALYTPTIVDLGGTYTKPKKPNTGLRLGSYVYKSKKHGK